MEIVTEVLIDRPASQVWEILTDFEKHPEWNPFIRSIQGKVATGEKLLVHISPPGNPKGMKFKPRVLKVRAAQEFRWKGKLLVPGLFDGEHYFRLEAVEDTKTRLIHGEKFTGLLVPMVKGMLADTKKGFELMNEALKKRAENL